MTTNRSGGCCSIPWPRRLVADMQRSDLISITTGRLIWIRNRPRRAAALIVDGIFLHRPELRPCWDLSIFLKVDFDVSLPRGAARGQSFYAIDPNSPPHRRYVGGQRRYLAECAPEQQADIVIDYNDMEAPRILKWVNA